MRTRIQGRQANRLLPSVALGLLLIVGLLASIAQAKIVIGQSVAGVKLGDSQAQVQQQLGTPAYTMPEPKNGIQWGFPAVFMGRVSFDATLHVRGMWTASKRQKTNKGIGPGSSLAQVRKAYPKIKCMTGPFGPKSLICVLKSKYQGRTVETAFPFFYRTAGAREVDIGFS